MELLMVIVANLLDIVITYYIANKLVKRLVIIDVKNILIAIVYGIAFGSFSYFTDRSTLYQITGFIAQFVIVFMIVKKSFASSVIAYGIYYAVYLPFQLITLLVLMVLGINTMMNVLFIQILTTICAIVVYKKVPVNKVFVFIEKHLILKFIILTLVFIGALFSLYNNRNASIIAFLLFAGIVIAVFMTLCKLGEEIYRSTYVSPLKHHDLIISLHGMLLKAYYEEDQSQIEQIKELCNKNGLSANFDFQLGKTKENILAFIEQKRIDCGREIEIISDIAYHKDHYLIKIDTVVKLLEILLDNALESGTSRPILITIRVDLGNISINVSNEYEMTTPDSINRMFDKGYSTKGKGRGFGLDNLYKSVKSFDGKIITDQDYSELGGTNYLIISIEI